MGAGWEEEASCLKGQFGCLLHVEPNLHKASDFGLSNLGTDVDDDPAPL